jgi:4-amino-4-deoxy-L-arabinose transferase-like glycosyltransferase
MLKGTAAFVGCCLVASVLVVASAWWQGMPDPDHYRVYAEKYADLVFDRGRNPDAFRPPLYPIALAPIVQFTSQPALWIAALHVLLMIAILAATWRIASRLTTDQFLPTVACLCVAIDPILVFQSGQIMTETIFTALLLWSLVPWLDGRDPSPRAALSGLFAGLAFLARPTMAPLFVAVGAAHLLRRTHLRAWLTALLIAFAVALPWALRNRSVLGELVATTTHGGYTLWLGNNPSFYRHEVVGGRNWAGSESFDRWQSWNREMTEGESELGKDEYFRNAALNWMREHPAEASQAALYRLSMFWGLQPRAGPERLRPLVGAYYAVFFVLALIGWFFSRSWRGPWLAATMVVLALTAVHAVYWSNIRFRAPIEPLLAVWAAVSIEKLWRSMKPAT